MNCTDERCPTHGSISLRGRTLKGKVVSTGMAKSVIVEVERIEKDQKYHRFHRLRSRIPAHVPDCIKVEKGSMVQITECRKLSKTKSFVVTGVIGNGR